MTIPPPNLVAVFDVRLVVKQLHTFAGCIVLLSAGEVGDEKHRV